MKSLDFFFHYKFVLRYLFINKFLVCNHSFSIPFFKKMIAFFPVKSTVDLNNPSTFNYFYFFRFFFGQKAMLTKRATIFKLGVVYHSFNVQIILLHKYLFFSLFFLANDILPFLNKDFLKIKFLKKSLNIIILDIIYLQIKKLMLVYLI